jgi:hypothetical protein
MTAETHRGWFRVHRNPLRMFFSAGPWAATAYLASYVVTGTVFFSVALTVLLTSYVMAITWVGIPLLVGAALIIRGCAQVERWRTRLVGVGIPASYRPVTSPGLFAQVKTRWADPATRRDCGYLILMFAPLFVLDVVALSIWLSFLAMVTLPLWYWSIPQTWENTGIHDHGVMLGYLPNGPGMAYGGFGVWVGSIQAALAASAVFFVLALLATYLVVGAARAHAAVARTLLGPYVEPLAAARRMLTEPGPLTPWNTPVDAPVKPRSP